MGRLSIYGGRIELRVQQAGEDVLVYSFPDLNGAQKMFGFLHEFFPGATFVIQPQLH